MLRTLTPSIGVMALLTTTGTLALDIIFAVKLRPTGKERITAIVASALLLIDLGALSLSVIRNIQTHDQNEKTDRAGKAPFIILAVLAMGLFFAVATTLTTLICIHISLKGLPVSILGTSLSDMLATAFTLCGMLVLFQSVYLVLLGVQARHTSLESSSIHADVEQSVIQRPGAALGQYPDSTASSNPPSPTSLSGNRKRSNSDAFSSIRSSLSNSVRPMTSRTRLLNRLPSTKSARSSIKESREAPSAIVGTNLFTAEDGFDSWDTSAVSQDSRQTISDSSPKSPFQSGSSPLSTLSLPPPLPHSHLRTFLETIPASPVVSRTPSPAFALDFPSKSMCPYLGQRSRSRSPANSIRSSTSNRRRSALPDPAEAHIHPLFRSDSPTPPPAVSTPGTSVTAAPNAGYVISESDRASLRRWRSDSLLSSPQISSPLVRLNSSESTGGMDTRRQQHQQLLDGANRKLLSQMERKTSLLRCDSRNSGLSDETEGGAESEKESSESGEEEAKTNVAIPEWILSGNTRNSMCGYKKRMLGSTTEEKDM